MNHLKLKITDFFQREIEFRHHKRAASGWFSWNYCPLSVCPSRKRIVISVLTDCLRHVQERKKRRKTRSQIGRIALCCSNVRRYSSIYIHTHGNKYIRDILLIDTSDIPRITKMDIRKEYSLVFHKIEYTNKDKITVWPLTLLIVRETFFFSF